MPERHRTSLRIEASFPIMNRSGCSCFPKMHCEVHFTKLCRCWKISDGCCFQPESNFCLSGKLSEWKNFRKLFWRASACARMFSAIIMCSAVLAKVPSCTFVCALSNCCVFARNAQHTDSCVFPTRAFVCAWSNSFVLARGAPDILIPKLTEQWRTCHFENFPMRVCLRSVKFFRVSAFLLKYWFLLESSNDVRAISKT